MRADAGRRDRSAFSLIELLVVLAIVATLIGILIPAALSAHDAARRTQCLNNLKEIGIALTSYHELYRCFPQGYQSVTRPDGDDRGSAEDDLGPGWCWASMILPQMEQRRLFDTINFSMPIANAPNDTAFATRISSFLCGSEKNATGLPVRDSENKRTLALVGPSSYVGVYGVGPIAAAPGAGGGIFFRNSRVSYNSIEDGSSQTLAVGERSPDLSYATWTGRVPDGWLFQTPASKGGSTAFTAEPAEAFAMVLGSIESSSPPRNARPARVEGFGSRHAAGINFLFADGSVRLLKDRITPGVYRALATRAGGEMISSRDY